MKRYLLALPLLIVPTRLILPANTAMAGRTVYVNAACDGTDAAPAIRTAIDTGAASIVLPACSAGSPMPYYTVASIDTRHSIPGLCYRGMFWLNSGQTFDGNGAEIKVANGALLTECGAGLFFDGKQSHITIKNLVMDLNGANNLATHTYKYMNAIMFQGGSYNSVLNNTILNDPGQNAIMSGYHSYDPGMSHFTASGNTIENGGTQLVGNTAQTDWSAIYTSNEYATIQNNRVIASSGPVNAHVAPGAGGIEVHNSNTVVSGNVLDYSAPGVYVANIDGPGDSGGELTGVSVADNTMNNVLVGVQFVPAKANYRNIDISGNTITLATIPRYTSANAYGILQNCSIRNIYAPGGGIITNSQFTNNRITGTTTGSVGIYLCQLSGTNITGNKLANMDSTALWFTAAPGGIHNTTISGNTITNAGTTPGHGVITVFYNNTLSTWKPSTAEAADQYITPTRLNGFTYAATARGTTGSRQPKWPTSPGQTVKDGSVMWTCEPGWNVSNMTVTGNTFSNANGSPPGYNSVLLYSISGFSSITGRFNGNTNYGQTGAYSLFGSAKAFSQPNR